MTERMVKITLSETQKKEIEKSIKLLEEGGIVCFPTDTVYGLGVDANKEKAVERLYQLKKREKEKPLILFPPAQNLLFHLVRKIPPSALKLISSFWPGPLTIIFEAKVEKPTCLVTKERKIGIRIPSHPVPRIISEKAKILFATTSANLSGEKAVAQSKDLSEDIRGQVDLIIECGKTPLGIESTVIDVTSNPPKILREGAIKREEIEKVLERPLRVLFVCTANMCRSVMAEAFFKSFVLPEKEEKFEVYSAGIFALSGSKPSEKTLKTMEKRGINIGEHLSTPLNEKLIKKSDLILVMEKEQKEHILRVFPQAKYKTWLLKEFSSGKEEEVSDPTGSSLEEYEKVACQLEEEIRKILKKMGENESSIKERPSWDNYFMQIAELVSKRSTCLRRKVGAVLVREKRILCTGYNGAPRGLPHCNITGCLREKLNIPSGSRQEICRGLHAEQNVIIQAALHGVSIKGSTLYCTHQPCITCSKMLINAGIKKIIFKGEYPDSLAQNILKEANVKLIKYGEENE
ncbi:threonylcarbamoyl-AMP synthase [Candidatus Aerophobetes bacterium]|nr:threonylcarbamoyl-AMP synthase [Candidatus Aerophobetes bacterium]